jgi:hypothetical protein
MKRKNTTVKNPKQCMERIKGKVAEKTGISRFVDLGETKAAFSGSVNDYDLYLSLDVAKRRGRNYLYAYMEDRLEWNGWEFDSQDDFENAIVEYLCTYINRTIKTVTETRRHKFIRVTEYYLDKETNQWVLMSDDKVSRLIVRPFIEDDGITEEITEYQL